MASIFEVAGAGNQAVEIDPTANGNVIRYAMAFESMVNLPLTFVLLFYPKSSLEYVLISSADNTPAAQSLAQNTSIMTLMISVLLWRAIPNTKSGLETRRPAYYMTGMAEATMIGLWVYQAFVLGEKGSGWKRSALQVALVNFMPLVGFRFYSLFVKPEWFGRYKLKAKAT